LGVGVCGDCLGLGLKNKSSCSFEASERRVGACGRACACPQPLAGEVSKARVA